MKPSESKNSLSVACYNEKPAENYRITTNEKQANKIYSYIITNATCLF